MPALNVLAIPAASIAQVPESEREEYIFALNNLPSSIRRIAASQKTASYVLGLTKENALQPSQAEIVAFAIFQILSGKKNLAQLPSILSTKLQIANDKAQSISLSIERDLIAPISKDLNKFIANKKKHNSSISTRANNQIHNNSPSQSIAHTTSRIPSPTPATRIPGLPGTPPPPKISTPLRTPPSPRKIVNKPAIPPNILDLKKKWEQPKPPSIPK